MEPDVEGERREDPKEDNETADNNIEFGTNSFLNSGYTQPLNKIERPSKTNFEDAVGGLCRNNSIENLFCHLPSGRKSALILRRRTFPSTPMIENT